MSTFKNLFLFVFLNSALISKCSAPLTGVNTFPYTIDKPDKKFELQKKLTEVSGLSFINQTEVALIDDEKGTVFYYDLQRQNISRTLSFSKKGDFEDLEIMGDTAYILRSDGMIFELKNINGPASELKERRYSTGLSSKNNTEGLCYDRKRKLFLISCKNKAATAEDNKEYKNKKAIYGFSIPENKLTKDPVIIIDENEVKKFAYGAHQNVIDKFMQFYSATKNAAVFQPSGLAIHPITGDLYIISSVGNILLITDDKGKIKEAIKMPPSEFKQPEGIAFDSEGNMFISNEGRKGKGNILKFNYQKN
jgi:hypothetical protein